MKISTCVTIAAAVVAASATGAFAQEPSASKPPILLESKNDSSDKMSDVCVEVEIGGDKAPSLGCLNQRLKRQVDNIQPSANTPPFDAKSQDVRIGIVNAAAAKQQMAPRPPVPTFVLRR